TKDAELWFEDGNVALVARNVAFRVYKGILARRSEVFCDLFSIPNPPDAETIDGVPAVQPSDSPDDLKHFLMLQVISHICGYFTDQDRVVAIKFAVLSALIRLSHKYAVHDILNQALSRLKKHYVRRRWDLGMADPASIYVDMQPKDAIALVQLARLTEMPNLLSLAFLQCTSLGLEL
ncbi:hypothetical protein BV20DRAFT_904011, partial [Pilatotrama ljubarskyi]